jgi:formylglycine-generating enzyme required for sulfatase activity
MKFLKVVGVILGALVITTLGINAADVFNGNSGSILGQIMATEEGACPAGMVEVAVGQTFSCVDLYEASPGEDCSVVNPSNNSETQDNINNVDCLAVSAEGQVPWTHIAREQAQLMCMRAGKRLPTAAEWYIMAIGTPDTKDSCNTQGGGVAHTGSLTGCQSATGVYDTVGNVWEWVSDDVIEGSYNGRDLPEDGYVTQVASDGIATVSESSPSEQFADDYIWTNHSGAYGILRGGFYGSREDAGVYSVQAKTLPTAATVAIGFRCIL